ncbi:M48 family metallopeptidase [Bacillus songklensis]|uniref:M48 family metallopeptidase n=1 Tax=Bacillus songklensis TaxID=1069116 RepID=A0ABV8B2E8_9BACI
MFSYQAGNITIDYTVEAVPNIQEITVNVCPNGGVKLVVPRGLNQSNLHFIIAKKAKWILEQLGETPTEAKEETAERQNEEIHNVTQAAFVPSFQDGDKIPYLGRQYRLNIVKEDKTEAELTFRAKFLATVPASWNEQQTNEGLQALLTDWYITRAEDKFQECLKSLAKQMDGVPGQIEWEDLQNEASRVKADGTIVLNWRLLTAPMSTIELVLAREIAKQTGAAELFEDAAERQQWLEDNTLVVF